MVAIDEHVAIGVFHHTFGIRCVHRFDLGPFVTAGDAFQTVRVCEDVIHLAHGAGRLAHREPEDSRWVIGSSRSVTTVFSLIWRCCDFWGEIQESAAVNFLEICSVSWSAVRRGAEEG